MRRLKPLVFQNFQAPVKPENVISDHRDTLYGDHCKVLKAGFLFLEEIQQSTIQMANLPSYFDPLLSPGHKFSEYGRTSAIYPWTMVEWVLTQL